VAVAELFAVTLKIVRSVGIQAPRSELAAAAGRRDKVYELGELRDVVAVGSRQRERQQCAIATDNHMVLAASVSG
jgi:hypothetical protein